VVFCVDCASGQQLLDQDVAVAGMTGQLGEQMGIDESQADRGATPVKDLAEAVLGGDRPRQSARATVFSGARAKLSSTVSGIPTCSRATPATRW